jgi:hypothetical protein
VASLGDISSNANGAVSEFLGKCIQTGGITVTEDDPPSSTNDLASRCGTDTTSSSSDDVDT